MGSKNWITNGSFDGARSSALMYSLIETAKLYGLNARNYLAYVFMKGAASHIWEIPAEELEPLMPWNVREEDLSIVTDEIDWLSRTMVPVQEWEERLATEGDKR
ncbi:MAG: transposase domain-containing protein [Proteiniphilum sp.]